MPSPSHLSHAPFGELKLKLSGSSGVNEILQSKHAECSL